MKNLTATALLCATMFGLSVPGTAHAEVGGYFSLGTAIGQTKSTYEGGLLFPLSQLNTLIAPAANTYVDPGFVGATKSKTGLRLEVGYDFFFVDDYYVGAFGQLDMTGGNGGNSQRIIGSVTSQLVGVPNPARYSVKDERYDVATQETLGSSYTVGLTLGRTFNNIYVAASLGYSGTKADLVYGVAFDKTAGTKLGLVDLDAVNKSIFRPDTSAITRASENLRGAQFGLEAGYSLNDSWDVVVSGSTVDFGKIAVDSPAGGSKLAVGFKATRGGIVLRRRF